MNPISRRRVPRCSFCNETGHKNIHCTDTNAHAVLVHQCYERCLQAYDAKNTENLIEWLDALDKPTLFVLAGKGSARKTREQLVRYIVFSRLYNDVYMAPHNSKEYTAEMREKYTSEMMTYV